MIALFANNYLNKNTTKDSFGGVDFFCQRYGADALLVF